MEEYLHQKNVPTILKDLVVQLCVHKPEDAVSFMVEYLTKYRDVSHPKEDFHSVDEESEVESPTSSHRNLRTSQSLRFSGDALQTSKEIPKDDDHDEGSSPISSPLQGVPNRVRGRRMAVSQEVLNTNDEPLAFYPKTCEQTDRLKNALDKHIMFTHLETEEKEAIFNAMFETKFAEGNTIIKQGDEGDNFYVVQDGECCITVTQEGVPNNVAVVGKGGSFGELALIYGSPRAATVTAKTDVTLWAIDRGSYRQVLMKTMMDKRKVYEAFLEKVPILAQLTNWERMTVADALEPFVFQDKDIVIKEGEAGDKFYIILEGDAEVFQSRESGQEQIATLHKSDYFGEVALLTDRPRAATVIAVGSLKCVGLDRNRFNRVLGPCENILRRNMENYNRYMADKI